MVTDIVIVIRDEAVTATAIDIIITEDIFIQVIMRAI